MSMPEAGSELDAGEVIEHGRPKPPVLLSPEQRKVLASICHIYEHGLNPRRLSRQSMLLALYIAFTLGFSVLLLNMTAFAPPGYLFLGFVVGALLKDLKVLMAFRRFWPVYDAIIDWPRAFHLMKMSGESKGEHGPP